MRRWPALTCYCVTSQSIIHSFIIHTPIFTRYEWQAAPQDSLRTIRDTIFQNYYLRLRHQERFLPATEDTVETDLRTTSELPSTSRCWSYTAARVWVCVITDASLREPRPLRIIERSASTPLLLKPDFRFVRASSVLHSVSLTLDLTAMHSKCVPADSIGSAPGLQGPPSGRRAG